MKKMRLVLFAAAVVAAVSCAKEIVPETGNENAPVADLVPMIFTAGTEDASTKVALQEDGKTLHWEATDQIKVFDGISNELPAFTTTESGASVTFAGQVSDGAAGPFYALYPYQEGATFGASTITGKEYGNVITATVPSEQIAVAGSIPSNAFIAAAVSDDKDNFYFKTICGFVKFQLSEEDAAGAVAVSLSGNNIPAISGDVEIYFTNAGETAFGQDYVRGATKDYITLTGTFSADTDYYFAIRSNKFAEGFTMTIKYADGSCKHVTSTAAAPQTVSRNMVMNLGKPVFKDGLPDDLYIAWQHGLDIDIAGQKYNKATYGDASLVKSDGNISKNGVYFINPGIEVSVTANLKSAMIAGRKTSERVIVTFTKQMQPTATEGTATLCALANADITYANANQLFNLKSDFDRIAIGNCSIKNIQHTLITANAFHSKTVAIVDSEIQIVGNKNSASYCYYSTSTSDMESFTFRNNIVYFKSGTVTFTDYKVYQCGSCTTNNICVENNVFDRVAIPNAGLVKAKIISGELIVRNNLYNDVVSASAHSNILGLDVKEGDVLPTSGDITNNFFYKSDSTNEKNLIINRTGLDALTKLGSPQPTLAAVLASDWDPDNKIFGIAESVQYVNNEGNTITVSTENIGAKR